MTPERWREIRSLFDEVCELPSSQRSKFLEKSTSDLDLRREVEEMLLASEEAPDLITTPAAARIANILDSDTAPTVITKLDPASLRPAPPPEPDTDETLPSDPAPRVTTRPTRLSDWEGRRVGPYRLVRKLAAGGMGAVYVAERADQQYEKQVAIKVVRPGMDTENILLRFLQERQVLAALDHPNIARMFDGGTTPEGMPYLVMEYVDGGVPIDVYCDEKKLDVEKRLKLFRTVCDALQYAHQNLIVHRDIKPQNILVTPDGVAKLLDFGIAKQLAPDAHRTELTVDSAPMTPDYASPEQVKNDPVTTSTDVYAMGVVLYRLLTGRSPYILKAHNPGELFLAITRQDPQRPSDAVLRAGKPSAEDVAKTREGTPEKLSKRLRGDIDVIVQTALQKEAGRRYHSVQHFSDDIRRHLEGLPVAARGDTMGYRVGKFIGRHKLATGATIAFTVGLIALTISSVYFATRARYEQAVAVKRFQDVHKLATFVVFEFDDAIRGGETHARRVLVEQALGYLNRLSAEAGDDPAILRDLANAYLKVGDIQGNPYVANIGDTAGAITTYQRAASTADYLVRVEAGRSGNFIVQGKTRLGLGDLKMQAGNRDAANQNYQEAARIFDSLLEGQTGGEASKLAAKTVGKLGFLQLIEGNPEAARLSLERSVKMGQAIVSQNPADREAVEIVARSSASLGRVLVRLGKPTEGIAHLRDALATQTKLSSSQPNQSLVRRDLATYSLALGDALSATRQTANAADSYRQAAAIYQDLLRGDPKNRQYLRDTYVTMGRLAVVQQQLGLHDLARQSTRAGLGLLAGLVDDPDATSYDLQSYVWLLVTSEYPELRDYAKALPYAKRAVEKGESPSTLDSLARAYHGLGMQRQAIETEQKAISLLPPRKPGDNPSALRAELEQNLTRFQQSAAAPNQ